MNYCGVLCVLLLLFSACTANQQDKKENLGSIEVKYAKHFELKQHDGYVELCILQPETGKMEYCYALGKSADKPVIPAGMEFIEIPVKNMAVLSTTHIGMLDAIDALTTIKGSTDKNFVANPTVLKGIESGKIANFTDESAIVPESLLEKQISLVVYSGFGKGFPNEEKLKRLHVFVLADYDWREEHPLGKAEWIKVFGYLTGKEKQAITYFNEVEKSYNETKKSLAKKSTNKSVLVGSLIGDSWYAPAGESYMATILKDAGANYIYKKEKGTGSCERTFEQVFKDQQGVPIWINPGATSLTNLKQQQARYGLFTAFQSGEIYCYTHKSNYFWEMGAVNPHWILSDFASILGNQSGKPLHFYQQLKN